MSFSVSFFTVIRETEVVFFGYFLMWQFCPFPMYAATRRGFLQQVFGFGRVGCFCVHIKVSLGKFPIRNYPGSVQGSFSQHP